MYRSYFDQEKIWTMLTHTCTSRYVLTHIEIIIADLHYVLVLPSHHDYNQDQPLWWGSLLVGLFWYPSWFCHWSFWRWSVYHLQAGPTRYPIPTCHTTFFSFLDPTQFSFENHQVSGNPKYQVYPMFQVYPTFQVKLKYQVYPKCTKYPVEIPDIPGNTWW